MNDYYCVIKISTPEWQRPALSLEEAKLSVEVLRAGAKQIGSDSIHSITLGSVFNEYQFDSYMKHRIQCGCSKPSHECLDWRSSQKWTYSNTELEASLCTIHQDIAKIINTVSFLKEQACPGSLK